MTARTVRTLVTMAVGALLIVLALANAGSVGASVSDRAFQVLGCAVGDYNCYYARLGGSPYSTYCANGYYTCTNGVPNAANTPANATTTVTYCGDNGAAGCINGSPLYVSTTINDSGTGLASDVIVSSGFLNTGTIRTQVASP